MTLQQQIQQKLGQISDATVLRAMGYHNLQAGEETLGKFLSSESLYLWLKTGNYDMKYNSEEFLIHLCSVLDISSLLVQEEIEASRKRLKCLAGMQEPYIFIDTPFKRQGEPIFAIAMMEGERHITIDKEQIAFMSDSDVLKEIGSIIKEHYNRHDGRLEMWGEIRAYLYHHSDGSKYSFDLDGTLRQNDEEIAESRAEMRIGNQNIDLGTVQEQ